MPAIRVTKIFTLAACGIMAIGFIWLRHQDATNTAQPPKDIQPTAKQWAQGLPAVAELPPTLPPASSPTNNSGSHNIVDRLVAPKRPNESPAELLARVQMAFSNGTPEQSLKAAVTVSKCARLLKAADAATKAGVRGLAPGQVRQLLSEKESKIFDSMETKPTNGNPDWFESEIRQCQVLDAQTLARRGELYARAYEGGAPNAAGAYLSWLVRDASEGQVDAKFLLRLRAEVSRTAEAGELLTLQDFVFASQSISIQKGFTTVEHQAYREAYFLLIERNAPGSSAPLRKWSSGMDQLAPNYVQLTEKERLEASALAEKILATAIGKRS